MAFIITFWTIFTIYSICICTKNVISIVKDLKKINELTKEID